MAAVQKKTLHFLQDEGTLNFKETVGLFAFFTLAVLGEPMEPPLSKREISEKIHRKKNKLLTEILLDNIF